MSTSRGVVVTQPGLAKTTIGVLGGTGPQGRGLALRWAAAGLRVVIGSRDAARA
ncbi:MAG: NAD(P)-binding domain-containing protein, partial [Actinomycetota bacterium]|nr:NAD(P)-binding domain-containing protein [Actinomycetota bacterium]